MKAILLIFFVLAACSSQAQEVSICSWNIEDLGSSKDDKEILYIASKIKSYDIIAIQEVVAGYGGAKAVAKLVDELNRMGSAWDYSVSDPTFSSSYKTERYAYIWKKSKVNIIGEAWLEKKYSLELDREPYLATFRKDGFEFTLVNFHAITAENHPETEVRYLTFLPKEYPDLNLIFCGDYNLPQSHLVFHPLKLLGYKPVFENQKTSLKKECIDNDCLKSEFDNFFLKDSKAIVIDKGVIHFYKDFTSFEDARKISDHIPVYVKIRNK